MANVQNSFIKSKLNKDLDARLVPNGEYRDARNVQVSRSEGPNVGSLENVLGNEEVLNLSNVTGEDDVVCIGYVTNEATDEVYLFVTNYTDPQPNNLVYNKNAGNFIIVFNIKNNSYQILVQGAFLNFSTTHEIYHANLLENLLFWTDNRNQPRVINTDTAKERGITYYQTEDQISVAKYNPYQSIELWQESSLGGAGTYESSMKDVTSKFLPSGGSGLAKQAYTSGQTTIFILSVQGDLAAGANANGTAAGANYGGATVGVVDGTTGAITMVSNAILNTVVYSTTPSGLPQWQINITGGSFPALNENQEIVFNPNPYYDENFAGDANYLEDKFVRFSYRYKFADNEYSIMAPFTQIAFIPKQDGYFMYKKAGSGLQRIDDQTDAFQSTIVSFMENKVDDIKLKIPLPFTKTQLANATTAPLKLKELEILYKESDGLAVKVIDVIPLSDIVVNPATDPNDFIYTYLSKKPTKTLPSDEITRVYDKIPVRAFAQEVSGNRIIYGNFQNKHTPPDFLDYNVGVGEKFAFSLENGTLTVPTGGTYNSGSTITTNSGTGLILVGSIVSTSTAGNTIPTGTQITAVTGTTPNISNITLSNNVTLTNGVVLTITAFGEDTQKVSRVEYPNSTIKQNRTYQVGIVLSDRYGRQSSVILSNNKTLVKTDQGNFIGDTIYSAYLGDNIDQNNWPGNALKILFNSVIASNKNIGLGIPGLYNGNSGSDDYNPLGWYTYKVVVKQTEQEYYNVYLPGIMASYPNDPTLELNRTSHVVLINDNINKVPRDLSEVGPDQKQFRSSVQLFGRVQNTNPTLGSGQFDSDLNLTNSGIINDQYYTGRNSDTVSTISTVQDLFDYNPVDEPSPSYFGQLYQLNSNPLVAKISTTKKIGQIATTNYAVASGLVSNTPDPSLGNNYVIQVKNLNGTDPSPGDIVTGPGLSENTTVISYTAVTQQVYDGELQVTVDVPGNTPAVAKPTLSPNDRLDFFPGFSFPRPTAINPGVQYLAVYETEPVESALDIFWETTTTGTISTLNNLILNATESAGGISAVSTSNWDEGIAVNTNIFNSSFTLTDSFGSPIAPSSINSVTLDEVYNSVTPGNGGPINVQTSDAAGPYFEIYSTSSGFFNIRTKQQYYNNIFFSNDAAVRTFTFNLSATTTDSGGDQTTNQLQIANVGPQNVAPSLVATFKTSGSTPADVPFNPASAIDGAIIQSSRFTSPVASLVAINGANNVNLRYLDFDWTLTSVIRDSNGANVTSQGWFTLTNFSDTTGSNPNTRRGDVTIQLSSIPPSNNPIPADIFTLTVVARDAAGQSQQLEYTFKVDLRIIPNQIFEVVASFEDPNDSNQSEEEAFVEMQITTGTISQNGWYIFPTANTLAGLAGQSITGGSIAIDESERVTTTLANSWGNGLPTKTFFVNNTSNSGRDAVRNLWRSSDFFNDNPSNYTSYSSSTAPNQGNYTYEFIP